MITGKPSVGGAFFPEAGLGGDLVGQHQLDAVFLVDLGGGGVVVDGHHIGVGVVVLQARIMPLPTMWLGRQPKGWAQTMLLVPEWMSSSISAVSSQPSPILQPSPK